MMTEAPPENQKIGDLVKGIVGDLGDLVAKQFQFATTELKQDMRRSGAVTQLLAIGVGVTIPGLLALIFTIAHLLHWLTSPSGADPASLPLWACFGLVSLGFLVPGAVFILRGKKKLDSFNPLPDKTLHSIKENVECLTNSK